MFKLTPAAEAVLTDVRGQSGKPDDYGVRFFVPGEPVEQSRLAFDFVASPGPDDTVDAEGGLRTFVAPDVDQMVGDAIVDIETVGDQASLVLRRPQPGESVG